MLRQIAEPSTWANTPIIRDINPKTGLIEGDDDGYEKMPTLPENDSPLVIPDVLCRPCYDGTDEYGNKNNAAVLEGGLRDGALVVRETVAGDLEDANRFIESITGGDLQICAVDGFRSGHRQAAGFNRMLRLIMQRDGLEEADVDDRVADFLRCGKLAHGTFCRVNTDVTSSQYAALDAELRNDAGFMSQLQGAAEPGKLDNDLHVYITSSANADLGRAAGYDIPLSFENNAHAGGGAVDVFMVDRKGRPINIVPFDYPGPEAEMNYMEREGSYEAYLQKAQTNELLKAHLERLGYTAETFTLAEWEFFRGALRILYHLAKAKRWTYYSGDGCGENWHLEPGNICRNVVSGEINRTERLTAGQYPDSGNPGHAIQMHGPDAIAVWGGASAHKLAAEKWGLEL
jgi:hypothetical protein